jgi:nicotinate dehydrogenase subunit B
MIELMEALAEDRERAFEAAYTRDIYGAQLSRRSFVRAGGVLAVGLGLFRGSVANAAVNPAVNPDLRTVDASSPESWIEIRPDNTVLFRTGKSDFGQGTIYTAYRQIVAEELDMPFEAITTVVSADTDLTPDGSGTFDLLGGGSPNIRKVAAYTRQALLQLASERLGVPKERLTVADGVVSGGGKHVTYGELVKDQNLKLTIPVKGQLTSIMGLRVDGNPPLKPVSSYKIIGKSYKNSAVVSKVTCQEQWVTNVKLPGMLHARPVHPATVGSRLISAGTVDAKKYPNAQVVVIGDLVAVVAPTEWETVQARWQVEKETKWTEWKGLPGNAKLYEHLRKEVDWTLVPAQRSHRSGGDVAAGMKGAAKTLKATYELPYMKHAPIGPTVAVGDYRPDGTVTVHSHTQNAQALRGELAMMLGVPAEKVIVKTYAGAGHYGRSNGGNAGAEDEAVLLSKKLGKPVRVQWMRDDDMQWSTQSPAAFSDVRLGLDANGHMVAYEVHHYMPAGQDDRPIGAVLAGLPTMPAPSEKGGMLGGIGNGSADLWLYERVPNLEERCHGGYQVGQQKSPLAIGLRDHSMRTPTQYQQNYPRECAINEAAALAGKDPLEFRLEHAKDPRLIAALERLKAESGWESRPSPQAKAVSTGSAVVHGRGVSAMFRGGAYWACACEVAVTPETGAVKVEKYTIVVDPGIVVNPEQLKRQVEGGAVMGISETLHEEVAFNEGAVTSADWNSYPILKMGEIPEIKVVMIHRPEVGAYGQGSEAANALAAPAIVAAVHDATGKSIRRLPLRAEYVKATIQA